jgi:redox-sensing transcriptional repressor
MTNDRKCILRLAKYRKSLARLRSIGFTKVFSENLADATGVSSSQVRKDFSLFKITGVKKGGYKIEELEERLNTILGKDEVENVVLVGYGNLGNALIKFKGFEKEQINIIAAFDSDEEKVKSAKDVLVLPINELKAYVEKNNIKTGIIAVPEMAAQQIIDIMISAGIKGILNFSPIYLRTPEDFIITNVNLGAELETVIYLINSMEKNQK